MSFVAVGGIAIAFGLAPLGVMGEVVRSSVGPDSPSNDLDKRVDNAFEALALRSVVTIAGVGGFVVGTRAIRRHNSAATARRAADAVDAALEERALAVGWIARTAAAAPLVSTGANQLIVASRAQRLTQHAVRAQATREAAWPASHAPKECPLCGGRLVNGGRLCVACGQTFP